MLMADDVEYTFNKRGSTYGAETGAYRRFNEGDTVQAPQGEFRHLAPGTYETRPLKAGADSGEGPDLSAYHIGGGYYDVPNREDNVRKDEAIAALKELDAEG